jgi:hypothetical protein
MLSHPNGPARPGKLLVRVLLLVWLVVAGPGLGLVWVQNQRERAKDLGCISNLRALGIAYHDYHDTMGSFPTENGPQAQTIYCEILDFIG